MPKNFKEKLVIPLFLIFQTLVSAQTSNLEGVVQSGHSGQITSLAFSPATWNQHLLASGGTDNTVKLWDTRQKRLLRTLSGHQGAIEYLAFTPDGKFLVSSGGRDNTLNMWNVLDGKAVLTVPDCGISALSLDGKIIACSQYHFSKLDGAPSSISIVDAEVDSKYFGKAKKIADLSDETEQVSALVFSPDGKKLSALLRSRFTTGFSHTLKIKFWEMNQKRIKPHEINVLDTLAKDVFEMPNEGATIPSRIVFSPDGNKLYLGDATTNAKISVWDVPNSKLVKIYNGLLGGFALNSDGYQLATSNCGVTVWEIGNGEKEEKIRESKCTIEKKENETGEENNEFSEWIRVPITFSKNDELIAYGGQSLTIITRNNQRLELQKNSKVPITKIKMNGFLLAFDGTDLCWEIEPVENISCESEARSHILKSSDGKLQAYVPMEPPNPESYDIVDEIGAIELERIENGKAVPIELINFPRPPQKIARTTSLAFSRSGNFLISGHFYGDIFIWDTVKGKLINSFKAHDEEVISVIFHPQKDIFFTISEKSEIKIWRITGDLIATWISTMDGWLLTTPEGFFDGTPEAQKEILWRLNNYTLDAVPVESFYYEFYYPGLLQKLLSGEKLELPLGAESITDKDIRQPEVRLCSKCPCLRNDSVSEISSELAVNQSDLCVDIIAPANFTTDDFVDFNSMAKRLTSKGAIYEKIFAEFAFDSQIKLKNYVQSLIKVPRKKPNLEIRQVLRREFDSFLQQEEFFEKFKDVVEINSFPPTSLSDSNSQTNSPNWIIRQWFEAAFPEIRKGKLSNLMSGDGKPISLSEYETDQKGECPQNELCLQDLRLFWNGRQIQRWRSDMAKHCRRVSFYRLQCETKVPLVKGIENKFRAYLFNQDRVKSLDGEITINVNQ